MKTNKTFTLTLFISLLFFTFAEAQYGYGNGRNGYGRQRSTLPQQPVPEKKAEPLTAEQIVEKEMPGIVEVLGLNEFERAIVSTTLVKSVRERMQLQLLDLTPEKYKEAYRKIGQKETEELRIGLPEDKFKAFLELREDGVKKTKKKQKKKKRRSKE